MDHSMMINFKKRFWVSLILTIPILVLTPKIKDIFDISLGINIFTENIILVVLASVIYFYGGLPFFRQFKKELMNKTAGMMTLITVAITVSYVYSVAVAFGLEGNAFFWELATLVDVMLLGHWIEMKATMRAGGALEKLAKLIPAIAHRKTKDGKTEDVGVNGLVVGDEVVVKSGERIPVDGVVVEGSTSVDESIVTGESKFIKKEKDDSVIAGSLNGEGSIVILVKKSGQESYLSQVIKLVKQAQQSKSRTQSLADKSAFWLTIIALTVGLFSFWYWIFVSDQELSFAIERAVTAIVIACPHALGLAIPLVAAFSTSLAVKNGFLIRNRIAFENIGDIDVFVFDKTGTITEGRLNISDVLILDKSFSADEILKLARSVESLSSHPIAKSIVGDSKDFYNVREFHSVTGKGVEGIIDDKKIGVMNPDFIDPVDVAPVEEGKSFVYVLVDEKIIGLIVLEDVIREDSKNAISRLIEKGVRVVMLTGDSENVAREVARKVGVTEFKSRVLPDKKMDEIKSLQQGGKKVAMIGDGVNDAPALAQANIGIAIGAGTDVAIDTADIILVKNKLSDVLSIINLADATKKKMIQNLIWATGYNLIALPIAAGALYGFGILLSPAVGALFMSLSTIIVAINASLLKLE